MCIDWLDLPAVILLGIIAYELSKKIIVIYIKEEKEK
jgi:hypothetical protein